MVVFKKKQVICTRMEPSIPMCQEEFDMLGSGRGWAVLLKATTQPAGAARFSAVVYQVSQKKDRCSRRDERNHEGDHPRCRRLDILHVVMC